MISMPGDLFAFLEAVSLTGFRKIEIRVELTHWDYDDTAIIKKIENFCRKKSIKVVSLHSPMSALISSPDEYERVKSLREIEKSVLIANRLGASFVVVHADTLNSYDRNSKTEALSKSLEELSDFSARWSVCSLIENLMPPRLASAPGEILSYLDIMKQGGGICLDLGHLRISGVDFNSLSKDFFSRVKSVHLNDNDGLRDRHYLPGSGDAPGHSKEDIVNFLDSGIECVVEASKSVNSELGLEDLLLFVEERIGGLID